MPLATMIVDVIMQLSWSSMEAD